TDILRHDLVALGDEILVQQRHEEFEFMLRSFPVLDTKAVQRQLPKTKPDAFLNRAADALYSTGMALDARQATLLGPAAVAVHDDGHVPRHLRRIEPGLLDPLQSLRRWRLDRHVSALRPNRKSTRTRSLFYPLCLWVFVVKIPSLTQKWSAPGPGRPR